MLPVFERAALAENAGSTDTPPGFPGMSLARNLPSREAVDAADAAARAAGATPLEAPCPTFRSGYAGCCSDPDGFPRELAHNPFFALDAAGDVVLPP